MLEIDLDYSDARSVLPGSRSTELGIRDCGETGCTDIYRVVIIKDALDTGQNQK